MLARDGVMCERLFCAGIPTHPAFTTMYTGQHPVTHGVVAQGGRTSVPSHTPMLPRPLSAGYTTCALDNLMRERPWFGRGYEYDIDPSLRRVLRLGVSCEELNARAIPWMREHQNEPFMLFMHYWEPHAPDLPPAEDPKLFYSGNATDPSNLGLKDWWRHPLGALARETWLRTADGVVTDPEYVAALYDEQIRHVDDGIAALLEGLHQVGLAENTLVVVVGDHGESMTEHGIFFEHHGLYDSTYYVPRNSHWPGKLSGGLRLPQMLQQHDLAPTILEALGVQAPRTMEGRSFWQSATGETQQDGRDVVVSLECSFQAKWSLRTNHYKLIVAREPDFYGSPMRDLYDLVADPRERHILPTRHPTLADTMTESSRNLDCRASRRGAENRGSAPAARASASS